ncbi:hypothetical protein [Shewanella sp.]|uniref:hypothetical protein n=1 Tax=Shewanella sp. TaxID=50422 RepID=UPI00356AD1D6
MSRDTKLATGYACFFTGFDIQLTINVFQGGKTALIIIKNWRIFHRLTSCSKKITSLAFVNLGGLVESGWH